MPEKNIFLMKNEELEYDRYQFLMKTEGNAEKIYEDALELKRLLNDYYNVQDLLPKV
jgi:hypothetical protein